MPFSWEKNFPIPCIYSADGRDFVIVRQRQVFIQGYYVSDDDTVSWGDIVNNGQNYAISELSDEWKTSHPNSWKIIERDL